MMTRTLCHALAALAVSAPLSRADSITLTTSRDNTLYEDASGSLSNGAGQYMFTGLTIQPAARRALIAFDLGAIPAGSMITSATLTLTMSRGGSSLSEVGLHRLTSNWGEGASDAPAEEGAGIAAAPGDATWLHTFFPGSMWTTPGGDFAAAASTTRTVGGLGAWTWPSTPLLVADLQAMLDSPAQNFGWLMLGVEDDTPPTAKRFNTREHPTAAERPALVIEYVVPAPGAGMALTVCAIAARRRRRG